MPDAFIQFVDHSSYNLMEALVIPYKAPFYRRDRNATAPDVTQYDSARARGAESRDVKDPFSIRSVLVPLDGTTLGEHALPYALSVAKRTGAVLHLVHVNSRLDQGEPWQMPLSYESVARRLEAKRAYLRDVARRIYFKHDVEIKTVLIDMDSTDRGLDVAAEGIDLVVMASRRLSRFRKLWSPSIADGIRRRLICPILLVRGSSAPVDLDAEPAMNHILLPLDGNVRSERIVVPAAAIGRTRGAAITLLNVQDRAYSRGCFVHCTSGGYLIDTAKIMRAEIPSIGAQVLVTESDVGDAIVDYAKRHDVDVIGVTTENRGSWSRLLRGSIADTLVRKTSVPILLLGPPPEKKLPELVTVFPRYAEAS